MTLKERLDAVWNTGGCLLPNHLVRWNESSSGYKTYMNLGFYFTKGRKLTPRPKRVKGKGYSFLHKNYGSLYRFRYYNRTI